MAELLSVKALRKRFSPQRYALDLGGLELQAGEIMYLLGHNGSGKSTFTKMLSGYHVPEAGGAIRTSVENFTTDGHHAIESQVINVVHQELGFIPEESVFDNIVVGHSAGGGGRRRRERTRFSLSTELASWGVDVDPVRSVVGDLAQAEQAGVAICRALLGPEDQSGLVLVLDEVTARLDSKSTALLLDRVHAFVEKGNAAIVISHRLNEVFTWGHTLAVLRDGYLVERGPIGGFQPSQVAAAIAGTTTLMQGGGSSAWNVCQNEVTRDSGDRTDGQPPDQRAVHRWFEIVGLRGGQLTNFNHIAGQGQVIGVTGLAGSGWEDVPLAIYGSAKHRSGFLRLDGDLIDVSRLSPPAARDAGIGLIPPDRTRLGLVGDLSIGENLTLLHTRQWSRLPIRRGRQEWAWARGVMRANGIEPTDPGLELNSLSGGNQQKVLVSRMLGADDDPAVRLALICSPGVGVDIGARTIIFEAIRRSSRRMLATIVASDDPDDLVSLCDEVVIFKAGEACTVLSGGDMTADKIIEACY
jgi:ribose transport system ATP-binding protein